MAGMIDAEGCIAIARDTYRKTVAHRLQVSVAGTEQVLFDWLTENFGGFVCNVKRYNEKHTPGFQWYVTQQTAADLLERVLPYLVIKTGQADVASRFIGDRVKLEQSGDDRDNEIARRERCYQEMAELNRKGVNYDVDVMPTRGKLTPDQIDLDYLAGMVDGDGCVMLGKSNKRRRNGSVFPKHELKLIVTNTSDALVRWLSSRFGGHCVITQHNSRWKTKIDWKLSGAQAASVLELIGPSLLIKGEQASIAQSFINDMQRLTRGSSKSDMDLEINRRESLYQRMRDLNQCGDAAATTKYQAPAALPDEAIV